MIWKRLIFYCMVALLGLSVASSDALIQRDEAKQATQQQPKQQQNREPVKYKRTTRRMLLERKFLIAQKQKLNKIAKTNPLARKYIRIINLQLLYIENELKEQTDIRRPRA